MLSWFRQLDELLRGERLRADHLTQSRIDLDLRRFFIIAAILGGVYGFFMGWYALFTRDHDAVLQLLASTLKLPALFLLTLGVTFPSLYVFNALIGCRMSFGATMRVLVAAIVINLAVAASLGPILAFFTLSTTSYPFMVLLNVALLGVAGLLSLGFLLRALRALARAGIEPPTTTEQPATTEQPLTPNDRSTGPLNLPEPSPEYAQPGRPRYPAYAVRSPAELRAAAADRILAIWVVIYITVGSQMGWILRPFIGSPDAPFTWFRPREGSFIGAVLAVSRKLIGID